MTKFQRAVLEAYAPVILREFGRKHRCQTKVLGARARWRKVYCRECNKSAIAAAKIIAKSHGRTTKGAKE